MAKVSSNASLGVDLKKRRQALLEGFWADLAGMITAFPKQIPSERAIPFAKQEVPNQETIAAINEYFDMKTDPEKYKRYETFDIMMKDIVDDA